MIYAIVTVTMNGVLLSLALSLIYTGRKINFLGYTFALLFLFSFVWLPWLWFLVKTIYLYNISLVEVLK